MARERWGMLVLLIVVLIATKVAARDDKCVIDVEVNNATFSVDYTLVPSPGCMWRRTVLLVLEPCEETECGRNTTNFFTLRENSGTGIIPQDGWYKLMACDYGPRDEHMYLGGTSPCFGALGQTLSSILANLDFTTEALSVTMKRDIRVNKTTLTVYRMDPKLKNPTSIPCQSDKDNLEEIWKDTKVNPTFGFKGPFSPTDCLCFEVDFEGHEDKELLHNRYFPADEDTCIKPECGIPCTPKNKGWIIGVIAVVGVILIFIAVIVALARQRWKRKRSKDIEHPEAIQLSPATEVFLLYTWDMATSIHLQDLRNTLAKCWKITELRKYEDYGDTRTRLEDENAWVERKVVKDASVRVVLVESEGLHSELLSILGGKSEEEEESDREKGLRRFALRSILAQETCNYSRMFVVRFGEGGPDERKDLNFLMRNRRYVLPGHLQTLMDDLGAGSDEQQKKEGNSINL